MLYILFILAKREKFLSGWTSNSIDNYAGGFAPDIEDVYHNNINFKKMSKFILAGKENSHMG